jgi:hypothetical protein
MSAKPAPQGLLPSESPVPLASILEANPLFGTSGSNGRLPRVLRWIEQLPEDDEEPSRYTAAIHRRYVSMWLKAAQISSETKSFSCKRRQFRFLRRDGCSPSSQGPCGAQLRTGGPAITWALSSQSSISSFPVANRSHARYSGVCSAQQRSHRWRPFFHGKAGCAFQLCPPLVRVIGHFCGDHRDTVGPSTRCTG